MTRNPPNRRIRRLALTGFLVIVSREFFRCLLASPGLKSGPPRQRERRAAPSAAFVDRMLKMASGRSAARSGSTSAHRGRGTLLSRSLVRYGAAIKVEEAMTYYTVSQPDGRGFPPHDDLVYEVGKTIRPTQQPSGHPRISARGKTYALPHYCSQMGRYPAAYLTAGNVATCIEVQQWPCRLFEVEGEPIKGSFAPAPEQWHRAMEASWNDAVLAANRPFSEDDTDDR